MGRKKKETPKLESPKINGRYTLYVLSINPVESVSLELLEELVMGYFDQYKIYISPVRKNVPSGVMVVGKLATRKRPGYVMKMIKEFESQDPKFEFEIMIYKTSGVFEKVIFEELVASSSASAEYTSSDIAFLNDTTQRYPWQQELLNKF